MEEREFPALLLRIDSPGGTVGDSQEIHAALMRLRETDAGWWPASAIFRPPAVYIGVAAEKIVSNPGTITGSIGVILRGNDLSRLFERIGIRFDTVKSGLFKDIPARPTPQRPERELLQQLIDSSYSQFVGVVSEGRGLSADTVRTFAGGRSSAESKPSISDSSMNLGMRHARRLAARLEDLDEDNAKLVTPGKSRRRLSNLLPGSRLLKPLLERLNRELMGSGQVLWLYRP